MNPSQTIAFQVTGRVQGVGFRHFTTTHARELGLVGWVRNNPDGSVSGEASGSTAALAQFQAFLRQGPRFGRVDDLHVKDLGSNASSYDDFRVTY